MGTGEFIEEMDHESINYFKSGAEIAEFFRNTFPMSETEGDRLAGYMEGHGYLLGDRDGKLYRGDLCCESDEMYWEAYALYDAVVAVGDWNYELLEEAGIDPEEEGAARQAGGLVVLLHVEEGGKSYRDDGDAHAHGSDRPVDVDMILMSVPGHKLTEGYPSGHARYDAEEHKRERHAQR